MNTLVTIDNVAGTTIAPPTPITARAAINPPDEVAAADAAEAAPNTHEADGQDAAAAEPVSQRASGQQETSEDQLVGVDEPLQRAVAGPQFAGQRR